MKIINLGVLTLSLAIIFSGCDKKEEPIKEKVKNTKVNIHTLKQQPYPIWVDFSGKTQAYKNVSITPRVTGELKETLFKDGQSVKKGDLLFKIDKSEYEAILNQKKAILEKNRASLNLAIANVNRYKPLVEKELAPKEKLDELIAQKKQYEATVNSDLATIKQAKLNVEYCSIKAPISGKIGKSKLDIGTIVTASTTLTSITQSSKLYVNFNPSNSEVSLINKYKSQLHPTVKIIPEQTQNIALELKGEIDFVDNVTNETTGTVAMRAIVDNSENILFPGTFVEIKLFITDEIPVIAIHPNNISQNQLGSYVYIVNDENKLETRQVTVNYSNEDIAIIKEGLIENDRVVVSATNRLRDNQIVVASEVANPIKK
mgnify:CR=1 FL=1